MLEPYLIKLSRFKIFLATFFIAILIIELNGQKLFKVYHGIGGLTQVRDKDGNSLEDKNIKLKPGEIVTIEVINPNPLFYNYSIKYNKFAIESFNNEILTILTQLNSIISTRISATTAFGVPSDYNDKLEAYKKAIKTLVEDINMATNIVQNSDNPESLSSAIIYEKNGGLRLAIDEIIKLPSGSFHFNNDNLKMELDALSQSAGIDDLEKEAFKLLNQNLIEKVNQLKKQINSQSTKTRWLHDYVVQDSTTKITLVISKIDKNNNKLVRDGNGLNDLELEICTVTPLYKRALIELVPVGNFIFSKNVREFYVDNGLIENRLNPKTTFSTGMILNMNVKSFGETNEFSLGAGIGYKFDPTGQLLENFYLSSMLSYKNFIRIGFGFGHAQFPSEELKGGLKVGTIFPPNVGNLNDLIQYREQLSGFLTISFTGLSLSNKK